MTGPRTHSEARAYAMQHGMDALAKLENARAMAIWGKPAYQYHGATPSGPRLLETQIAAAHSRAAETKDRIMAMLSDTMTTQAIIAATGQSKNTVTRALQRLVGEGLVRRGKDGNNATWTRKPD